MSSYASINVFSGIRTTLPGNSNNQIIPLARVEHFDPCSIGASSSAISSFQLMGGALVTAPLVAPSPVFTMPTAANLLNVYAGNLKRVNAGDVFRIPVFNNGGTGIAINSSGVSGVTGSFVAGTGASSGGFAGLETPLHINWLQVSADGTTGAYQIY